MAKEIEKYCPLCFYKLNKIKEKNCRVLIPEIVIINAMLVRVTYH
ncbi:hypothetical protein [Photobacterium gaetbulicola]|nr:hypothetical protein [Photobacterium gaetbulicola]